jgi:hypothetical protein
LTVPTSDAELRIAMKRSDERNLILTYIYLALGCVVIGTVVTFVVLLVCDYFGVDIFTNLWVLAIPSISALFLNVLFIELYHKVSKR